MSTTNILLQEDIEKMLDKAVSELHRSRNWIVNQALREYLAHDMNDQLRWQETVEALKSASEGKLVGSDKVHAWLESWGKDGELPPPGT